MQSAKSKIQRELYYQTVKETAQHKAKIFQFHIMVENHGISVLCMRHNPTCDREVFRTFILDKLIELSLMSEIVLSFYNEEGTDLCQDMSCIIHGESTATFDLIDRIKGDIMTYKRTNEVKHNFLYDLVEEKPVLKLLKIINLENYETFTVE